MRFLSRQPVTGITAADPLCKEDAGKEETTNETRHRQDPDAIRKHLICDGFFPRRSPCHSLHQENSPAL
jgi:hypothetical protein